LKVLEDAVHSEHVHLSRQDQHRLNIWLDGNAPFYGTYDKEQQLAQRDGKAVSPPQIQ
jgi:hypothetical protein